MSKCARCGKAIEYVPTPPGTNPRHHPPYWRHVGGSAAHAAKPS
jgi:hypothetical protein